jgi:hypothetical protein
LVIATVVVPMVPTSLLVICVTVVPWLGEPPEKALTVKR